MQVTEIHFEPSTFGITQKSLKALRDAIMDNFRNGLLIVEVPTSAINSGFFVFDNVDGKVEVTYTGDGFRTDGGGEGGKGRAAAVRMIESFGLDKFTFFDISENDNVKNIRLRMEAIGRLGSEKAIGEILKGIADEIIERFEESEFTNIFYSYPKY